MLEKATEAQPEPEQSMGELNELTSHLLSQMEQTLQTPLIDDDEMDDLKEDVDPAAEKKQMLIKFKFERI